jgi:hypothetical protein
MFHKRRPEPAHRLFDNSSSSRERTHCSERPFLYRTPHRRSFWIRIRPTSAGHDLPNRLAEDGLRLWIIQRIRDFLYARAENLDIKSQPEMLPIASQREAAWETSSDGAGIFPKNRNTNDLRRLASKKTRNLSALALRKVCPFILVKQKIRKRTDAKVARRG